MKENKISVELNKSASDVFRFTINPSNTATWIERIKKEETNEWPVKVGLIYKNVDNYHVRYTYTPISETKSHLEYYEWVNEGNLERPFSKEVLSNLKRVIEQ